MSGSSIKRTHLFNISNMSVQYPACFDLSLNHWMVSQTLEDLVHQ